MIARAKAILKKHEGLRLKPYRDTVGKLTIGYGRNLDARGITTDEATEMLEADIYSAIEDLRGSLPWFDDLDETRQVVLVDMAYNLGIAGLLKFKRMLAAVETARWEDAAAEMLLSKWADQVGGRAAELAEMMRAGQ